MPKDLYKKPRKKNKTQVVEGPVINPIKPPADNPGPNPPKPQRRRRGTEREVRSHGLELPPPLRKGGCPSGGGGGGSAIRVHGPNSLPPTPKLEEEEEEEV